MYIFICIKVILFLLKEKYNRRKHINNSIKYILYIVF